MVVTPTFGPTVKTGGAEVTAVTAMKSSSGRYGRLLNKRGFRECVTIVPMKIVCPSLGDFAAASAPMIMLAPGRLSTTTGCASVAARFGAIWRARRSDALPGPSGTMKRIGLDG